jgi:hypothetical protein
MLAMPINWSLSDCSCPSWNLSMDESALRSALASANDCGSLLQQELRFWTWVVVVGVALELGVILWEYIEELHDFRRGFVHPPDKPNWLLYAFGFVAAGLVVLGVGGELHAESKIDKLETCIRKGNDALFLLLSKEAGDARDSAQKARDAAKQAWEYAAWRTISDKQAELMRKRIRSLKGHKIVFFGNFQDAETQSFAKRLAAVLDDKIMEVSSGVWQISITTPPGMKFGYGKNRKGDFDLIVRALDEAGVERAEVLRRLASPTGEGDDGLSVTIGPRH